jgi:hypothetical protein
MDFLMAELGATRNDAWKPDGILRMGLTIINRC